MSLFSAVLDLVYPRYCAGCGQAVDEGLRHLCWDCRRDLHIIAPPFCERCGDPVDGDVRHAYTCSWCVEHRTAFDRARSAGRYRGVLRASLQAFKYNGAAHLCAEFVDLLEACARIQYPRVSFDAVTFVPLHAPRERHRGYNQARLLAAGLSARLGLGREAVTLRRTRATGTQTHLTASQRRANVHAAFAPADAPWVTGRTLLLVDDVMTTGATCEECARVLKGAGAAGVYVVTVARG